MEHHTNFEPAQITLPESGLWPKLPALGLGLGVVGLGLSFGLGAGSEDHHLAFSYLTSFVYWLTLALGGLFFMVLHYLSRAGWSVVVRRLAEKAASTLPLFAVLFLPIAFFWMHDLFHWTHADAVAHDPLLAHKAPYLNTGFFYVRAAIYFIVWITLSRAFIKASNAQDESRDEATTGRLNKWSAVSMVLFAVTLNFAAFDWLMSLEPHWFSTIFGVYVFAGSVVAIFAFLILTSIRLQAAGALQGVVTDEHYHDMGKMLFGFVVFWAYIGFSQFMLIWYANIPEETLWFDHRWQHGWQPVSIFLAAGHFGLPFFYLISQPVKRHKLAMTLATLWLLFMHWVDIYWLVMPTLGGFHPSLVDVTCWLGIGGFFLAALGRAMQQGNLVPTGDPRLAESLAFENA